ncbi:Hypothetical protein POVN_LOCUS271 [uncultured virus]|nr:Hypothetical protein POVN_LOCUS271 [uncultured virus]
MALNLLADLGTRLDKIARSQDSSAAEALLTWVSKGGLASLATPLSAELKALADLKSAPIEGTLSHCEQLEQDYTMLQEEHKVLRWKYREATAKLRISSVDADTVHLDIMLGETPKDLLIKSLDADIVVALRKFKSNDTYDASTTVGTLLNYLARELKMFPYELRMKDERGVLLDVRSMFDEIVTQIGKGRTSGRFEVSRTHHLVDFEVVLPNGTAGKAFTLSVPADATWDQLRQQVKDHFANLGMKVRIAKTEMWREAFRGYSRRDDELLEWDAGWIPQSLRSALNHYPPFNYRSTLTRYRFRITLKTRTGYAALPGVGISQRLLALPALPAAPELEEEEQEEEEEHEEEEEVEVKEEPEEVEVEEAGAPRLLPLPLPSEGGLGAQDVLAHRDQLNEEMLEREGSEEDEETEGEEEGDEEEEAEAPPA